MKKRILLFSAAFVAVAVGVVGMSAFEAHVINVTAQIENALSVIPDEIIFGTVFPQEEIDKNFKITLSSSFMDEERVDDVEYFIRQKPKPRPEAIDEVFNGDVIAARHWCYNNHPETEGYYNNCYYNLCPYLSKHPDIMGDNRNDGYLDAFHSMDNDVNGRLAKSDEDTEDVWTVDLKVPCFEGHCDQGYEEWVYGINPSADPAAFVLDPSLEHEMFGCDLWVEVTDISRSNKIGIYEENDDYPDGDPNNMLGMRIGTLGYNPGTGILSGTVDIDDNTNIDPAGNYLLVLNGPRTGSTEDGYTNELLASAGCADDSAVLHGASNVGKYGWDGWWSNRVTDNTGTTDTNCDGLDDNDSTVLQRMEGYYNFEFDVSGQDLINGYPFSVALTAGSYNEVQFLIKDLNSSWQTVGEYPGAGEADGLTSYFDFTIN